MKLRVREAEHKKFPDGPPPDDVRPRATFQHGRGQITYYRNSKPLSVHCISTSQNHHLCKIHWCECECHFSEDYLDCMMM